MLLCASKDSLMLLYTALPTRPTLVSETDRKADQSLLGSSFFVLSAITVSCLSHLQRPSGLKEKTNEGHASCLAPGQPEPSCLLAVVPLSREQGIPSDLALLYIASFRSSRFILETGS